MMIKFKASIQGFSSRDQGSLNPDEIEDILQRGRKWNLLKTLSQGGSVLFPHTLIRTCGDQVAAVVHGCLDAGAGRVIALGVLHSLDRSHVISARMKANNGEDITGESCWGIFGPYFPGDQTWQTEYSLQSFCFLWNYEVKRRRLSNPPELILAYPCLANRQPSKLPGIEQLKSYLPNSIVVATTDFCHHGIAYRTPEEKALPISKEAEQLARSTIEEGLQIFKKPNHSDFQDFCHDSLSDGTDVGQVLMELKGPLKSRILGLRLVDTAHLYEGDPSPSWVAASLIEMTPFGVVN